VVNSYNRESTLDFHLSWRKIPLAFYRILYHGYGDREINRTHIFVKVISRWTGRLYK
jgi:hypothetical protein